MSKTTLVISDEDVFISHATISILYVTCTYLQVWMIRLTNNPALTVVHIGFVHEIFRVNWHVSIFLKAIESLFMWYFVWRFCKNVYLDNLLKCTEKGKQIFGGNNHNTQTMLSQNDEAIFVKTRNCKVPWLWGYKKIVSSGGSRFLKKGGCGH